MQIEEVMQFRLLEKKTFLEFVPSNAEPLRRSLSLPELSSSDASEHAEEEDWINNPIPKVASVHEHDAQRVESDVSPGEASMLGVCTVGRVASTRCGSNASLLTSLVDSTRRGNSWLLEEDLAFDGVPDAEHYVGLTSPAHSVAGSPKSPQSAVSGSSSTTMGSLQPSHSVGSALHAAKLCRPCAWYWRPGSCTRGADCLHCHLCADGELAKRRFENRKLAKQQKKQRKAEGYAKSKSL